MTGLAQVRAGEAQGRGAPAPAAVVAHWTITDPVVPADADWTPLHGGRTNAIWRVDTAVRSVVVKLFRPGSDTPLFRNDPAAEALALEALDATGLAPKLLASGETGSGPSLAYGFVPGRVWRPGDGVRPVAEALARLHRLTPPAGLGTEPGGAGPLCDQGRRMLAEIGATGAALAAREPNVRREVPPAAPVFLHGDPTAGNALVGDKGVTFIDWQCPARGDPTSDLAVFLSPAMQAVSGNRPLTSAEEAAFLEAYGDGQVVARYRALAPLYHWRMAAYCLWRAARGDRGYGEAAALEAARLTG